MSAVKDLIGQAVDRLGDELEALSRQIHDNTVESDSVTALWPDRSSNKTVIFCAGCLLISLYCFLRLVIGE